MKAVVKRRAKEVSDRHTDRFRGLFFFKYPWLLSVHQSNNPPPPPTTQNSLEEGASYLHRAVSTHPRSPVALSPTYLHPSIRPSTRSHPTTLTPLGQRQHLNIYKKSSSDPPIPAHQPTSPLPRQAKQHLGTGRRRRRIAPPTAALGPGPGPGRLARRRGGGHGGAPSQGEGGAAGGV